MKKIALFFSSDISKIEQLKIINSTFNCGYIDIYSNVVNEKVLFIDERLLLNDVYSQSRKKLIDVYNVFYNNHRNSPLFNSYFNFWPHLRFNSFLQILNFYKVQNWVDYVKMTYDVKTFKFIDLNSKTINLLKNEDSDYIFFNTKNKLRKNNTLKLLYKILKVLFMGIYSSIFFVKSNKRTLLISKRSNFSNILNDNEIIKEDRYLYQISKKLDNNEFDRFMDSAIYSKKGLLNYKFDNIQNRIKLKSEGILFLSLFNLKLYKELYKTYFYLKNILNTEQNFLNTLIKNNRSGLFSEFFTFWTYYFFLKKSNYRNVIITSEMSPLSNSIVRASKLLNINIIGVQHGIFNINSYSYNFTNEELKIDNPFPNKLVVWGKDETTFLSKNKEYLNNVIQPLGNVVFDACRYLKEPKKKKFTIMFATQPQPISSNIIKSISDFTDAILKFKDTDINIIIRLHPREVQDYSIYQIYLDKLKTYNLELDKGKEIFSQINKADVLVTSYSTVSKDAMILRKHIVLMDYTNSDFTGLISKGIAKNTLNSEHLFTILADIKNGKLQLNKTKYENELSKIFTHLDFNTSERIIKLLK